MESYARVNSRLGLDHRQKVPACYATAKGMPIAMKILSDENIMQVEIMTTNKPIT